MCIYAEPSVNLRDTEKNLIFVVVVVVESTTLPSKIS